MAFLIRILGILVLFAVIRYLVVRFLLPKPSAEPPSAVNGRAHQDPECGLYVAEELALRAPTPRGVLYFCSADCRDRFLGRAG